MKNVNRIHRSENDKMIAGVAAGLAEYFNIDPVFMRLIFVIVFLAGGSGILIYIVLWIIMPKETPSTDGRNRTYNV